MRILWAVALFAARAAAQTCTVDEIEGVLSSAGRIHPMDLFMGMYGLLCTPPPSFRMRPWASPLMPQDVHLTHMRHVFDREVRHGFAGRPECERAYTLHHSRFEASTEPSR